MTSTITRSLPSRFARAQIELTVADRDYTRALTWSGGDLRKAEPAKARYEAAKAAFAAVSTEYHEAIKADRASARR